MASDKSNAVRSMESRALAARAIHEAADHQREADRLRELGDALVGAIHGLDSYAAASFPAPLERTRRAEQAVEAWRAATTGKENPTP